MNDFFDSHWYQLTHSVLVFGVAGLVFYIAMMVSRIVVKYGVETFGFERLVS